MDLHIQHDENRENCFASLSPSDFSRLSSPILQSHDPECFLFVLEDPQTSPGRLVLGKHYADCLNLESSSIVKFHSVSSSKTPVPSSTLIVVTPDTADDWEVVESQSTFLESIMLSQIKLVHAGLRFPVWVARGQRPLFLRVSSSLEGEFHLLQENSEIAVEARKRVVQLDDDFSAQNRSRKRSYLPLRVVDTGFPDLVSDPSLLGIGMIVHVEDFKHAFGPDSGCLVTVRDRADILTMVACDSKLVDRGVVLVAPWMRDNYGLVSGERIVLEEQQAKEMNSNLIIAKKFFLFFPANYFQKKNNPIHLFKQFVRDAGCVIVPQGGWMGIPVNREKDEIISIQVKFESSDIPPSKVGAIITSKLIDDFIFECYPLPDGNPIPPPKPFLKYVAEAIRIDSEKFGIITKICDNIYRKKPSLPSFAPIVTRIAQYFEKCLTKVSLKGPFIGSVLLTASGPGSGRTTAMLQAIESLSPSVPCVVVDCEALADAAKYKLDHVKSSISGLVRFGFENPPFCLFLDNIDVLIPPSIDSSDPALLQSETFSRTVKRGRIIAEYLREILRDLQPNRSIIIAATSREDSVTLAKLFTHHERLPSKLTEQDRLFLHPSLVDSDGLSLMELIEAASLGGNHNRDKRRELISGTKRIIPQTFSLGGLKTQIDQLEDAISLPLKYPALFKSSSGLSIMATGAFVVGPTGTGKSALIDHVVTLTNLPVEIVRGPDLLDKYIGASEQGVRRVFEKAAAMAPCVVVFDTIDALCPRRGSESTGVTDRVVNQMLCYLDGVEKVENVFVIAVSSRPDMVDPALTRPGRLDLTILCDIPTKLERKEILQALSHDFAVNLSGNYINEIESALPDRVTGADLRAGFVNAQILAQRGGESRITFELILDCMKNIKPSISERDAKFLDQVFSKYRGGENKSETRNIGTKVMLY